MNRIGSWKSDFGLKQTGWQYFKCSDDTCVHQKKKKKRADLQIQPTHKKKKTKTDLFDKCSKRIWESNGNNENNLYIFLTLHQWVFRQFFYNNYILNIFIVWQSQGLFFYLSFQRSQSVITTSCWHLHPGFGLHISTLKRLLCVPPVRFLK